jgi:deoxyribodipyrimidine photo-lyase
MPILYWFRHDLRTHDNLGLALAIQAAQQQGMPLHALWVQDEAWLQPTRWGFVRCSGQRLAWWQSAVRALQYTLTAQGIPMHTQQGQPTATVQEYCRQHRISHVFCESIAAPDEQAQIITLQNAGLQITCTWQSSLLCPQNLPFPIAELPQVFTRFREQIEHHQLQPPAPRGPIFSDLPSSEPASEQAAQAHVLQYFASPAPWSYKHTRNNLMGPDFSSRWSPWLATGALSARWVDTQRKHAEALNGANDSTYWLWFELLWRDYFRFLHLQHGRQLYQHQGLSHLPRPSHDAASFEAWTKGCTPHPLVNAGMRELAATGWLSNRMRQVVASYLIHDCACDWRAGAAWFESQLLDYDPYSNQGNWLYIAGRGTDPRQGRRFNPDRQAQQYDPQGIYQQHWLQPTQKPTP